MKFKYVRLQGRELSYITQYPKGIFGICWRMIYDGVISKEDEETFRQVDDWFMKNLPEPPMCKTGDQKVVCWFKTETTAEMMRKIEPAMGILEKYGHPYDVVYTNFVDNVVYEDEWQVAVQV